MRFTKIRTLPTECQCSDFVYSSDAVVCTETTIIVAVVVGGVVVIVLIIALSVVYLRRPRVGYVSLYNVVNDSVGGCSALQQGCCVTPDFDLELPA